MSTQPPPRQQDKRRRHLMDLDAPRPVRDHESDERSLTNVQRWVASTIAVTTLLHMTGAVILSALYLDNPPTSSLVILAFVAAAFTVMAIGSWLFIHGKKVLSPWLVLGILPGLLTLWLTMR